MHRSDVPPFFVPLIMLVQLVGIVKAEKRLWQAQGADIPMHCEGGVCCNAFAISRSAPKLPSKNKRSHRSIIHLATFR